MNQLEIIEIDVCNIYFIKKVQIEIWVLGLRVMKKIVKTQFIIIVGINHVLQKNK